MTREEAKHWIEIELKTWEDECKSKHPIKEALSVAIEALEQEPCEDSISRADALRVAKNEYLRGWHNALCKALSEKYSIHCEEGNFSVIQEETITGLGLSMNCAVGKDVESYMSTIPSVTPQEPKKGHWIMTSDYLTTAYGSVDYVKCSCCGEDSLEEGNYCPNCGAEMSEVEE